MQLVLSLRPRQWTKNLLLFAGLSTLSLPGLSSFVSEFMVLAGTFSRHPAYAVVSTLAIVLASHRRYLTAAFALALVGTQNPPFTGIAALLVAAVFGDVARG